MSLYKCPDCEMYFKLPKEHYTKLQEECKEQDGIAEHVIECQCGFKMVSGCEEVEEDEYYMFSNEINKANDTIYKAIMLIECTKARSTDSTYEGRSIIDTGRVVYLRPMIECPPDLIKKQQAIAPSLTVEVIKELWMKHRIASEQIEIEVEQEKKDNN